MLYSSKMQNTNRTVKSSYQLISFDLDGTLLNSKKEISERNIAAVNAALSQNKTVIFSTGRSLTEVQEYIPLFPHLRYISLANGALLYDLKEQKELFHKKLSRKYILPLLNMLKTEDIMPIFITNHLMLDVEYMHNLAYYQADVYQKSIEQHAELVPHLVDTYLKEPFSMDKFLLFAPTAWLRDRLHEKILGLNLPLTVANSEATSLEITAKGISKGSALRRLCKLLDLSMENTIAVGDSGNDAKILQTAGLAIAMANATDDIKTLADVIVADCDHDGCAEVIEHFLLK